MPTDVEIDRALNALNVTLNDQQLDRVDVERLERIVAAEEGLHVVADELQPEQLAWVRDDRGDDVGRVELTDDGRWRVERCGGTVITQAPPPVIGPVVPPGAGFRDDGSGEPAAPPVPLGALVAAGAFATPVLVASLMLISEIAGSSTWAAGVDSSAWTPLRGVAALVFGTSTYGGDFDVLPILAGLALVAVYAVVLGAAGAALIVAACGPQPPAGAAIGLGVAWALLVMQALVINVAVGLAQSAPTVYESLPTWGWWVAHAAYGAALGLATTHVARRTAP